MLWRLLPELRATFGYGDLKRWVELYGVRQKTFKIREGRSGPRQDGAKSKRREEKPLVKELPGISPLALRHLLDSCLFLELADVAPGLPPYTEEAVVVPMGNRLGSVYTAFERETTAALRDMLAHYDTSGLAAWFQGLMAQPNLPWRGVVTQAPGGTVLGQAEPLPEELVYPKERALLDLVRRERAEGRRTLVYVEHTGAYDLLPRLKALLEADDAAWRQEWNERGQGREDAHSQASGAADTSAVCQRPSSQPIRVALLRSGTVPSVQREAWLARTVEEGCDVLLCHSGLVEVGLDLLDFPTIIVDEVIFSTTRVRQATRRSYRPGQTLPVRVVQLVYDHTMEARGLALIASKIKSSLMVEGKLPGEGLSSFAQGESAGGQGDLLLELARSVLAEEDGVARDVAGSLEATFRELATAEQEQNGYIGAIAGDLDETSADADEDTEVDQGEASTRHDALDAWDTVLSAQEDDHALDASGALSAPSPSAHDGFAQHSAAPHTTSEPLPSTLGNPWEEWLRAHGVMASPQPRHQRIRRSLSPAAHAANTLAGLPPESLWAPLATRDNSLADSGSASRAEDHAATPAAAEAPSLWEQME
jgi:hypothetical protein